MSGKGSAPRPFSVSADEYADRFDAIFGRKTDAPSSNSKAAGSNPANLRANRSGAANYMGDYNGVPVYADGPDAAECLYQVPIYVDNETGAQVTEDWWPGDPTTNQESAA